MTNRAKQKPLSLRVVSGLAIGFFFSAQLASQNAFAFFQFDAAASAPAFSSSVCNVPTATAPEEFQAPAGEDAQVAEMNLRFIYNTKDQTVTAVDLDTLRFSAYRFVAGRVGRLLMLGTAETVDSEGGLTPKEVIEFSQIKRNGKSIPVYIFKKAGESGYLIRERLNPAEDGMGVIGRVLRYKGDEGDFEYFYDEGKESDHASVTVLNYTKGEFLRFGIAKETVRRQQPANKVTASQADKRFENLASSVRTESKAMSSTMPLKFFMMTAHAHSLKEHAPEIEGLKWTRGERGPPCAQNQLLISTSFSGFFSFVFAVTLHSYQLVLQDFHLPGFADSLKFYSPAGTVRRAVSPAQKKGGAAL